VFLDRELERKAEMRLKRENLEWEKRKAVLKGKRFNVVPLCNIKSHFVSIDPSVLYGIMEEISPEFKVSTEDFTGENRVTYWRSIFDFKPVKVSKQKVFTGLIKTDGVALCVHYRRLKKDRPVPHSAAPVTKDAENKEADAATQKLQDNDFMVDAAKDDDEKEAVPETEEMEDEDFVVRAVKDEEKKKAGPAMQEVQDNDLVIGAVKDEEKKEAGPAMQEVQDHDLVIGAVKDEEKKEAGLEMQKVQDNDLVVGVDPGNTNIITIAAPKRAEDGTDGNLRQKDMRLLRFSRAKYYRESGTMNARKKIETWNAGRKDHLEALSEVTSRGADFQAFRKFMDDRVAHWDALREEYTKPRWARLRMNRYGGKQRAFSNLFNHLSALKEDKTRRLVVAYGAGRWKIQKGTTPAPTTRTYKECVHSVLLQYL